MSRLFWKFFIVIWIAQIIGTMSVMVAVELRDDLIEARESSATSVRPVEVPDSAPRPPHGSKILPTEPFFAHLFASLIVAAILAHYLSRPIRSLRSAFQAIASGNLQVGVANAVEKRKDEMADLLREFDRMTEQLSDLMNAQRRLLHDVSHEVRSPLARMQMAIGLARQQPDKTSMLLDRIDTEIMRIDRLIGELLSLSRLETAEAGALNDEVAIDELLTEIADSAKFEAESAGKKFHLSGTSGAIVKGSAEPLHRAIENVVRNAIKHTQEGSVIQVKTWVAPLSGMLHIAISDDGPGVPDAEIDAIFKPFFRGSKTDSNANGHGLGLAITRRVAEAHGGGVCAFNLANGGLCVEIALPVFRRG